MVPKCSGSKFAGSKAMITTVDVVGPMRETSPREKPVIPKRVEWFHFSSFFLKKAITFSGSSSESSFTAGSAPPKPLQIHHEQNAFYFCGAVTDKEQHNMTSRERIAVTLSGGIPDRVGMHESPWGDTVDLWREQGLPANKSVHDYFDMDITGVGGLDLSFRKMRGDEFAGALLAEEEVVVVRIKPTHRLD